MSAALRIKSVWVTMLIVLPAMILGGSASLVYGQSITVPAGSTLDVNTGTLNVPGSITNNGTLSASTGTITVTGDWTNNNSFVSGTGTVSFIGTTGTQSLNSGGDSFHHLSHTQASTVNVVTNDLDINGDFINSAGTFTVGALNLTIGEDFTLSGGSFSITGDTTFDTTATSSISGSPTFVNLTSTTAGKTINFAAGSTTTVNGTLDLTGAAGNLITLQSTSQGTRWNIDVAGAQTVSFISLEDSEVVGTAGDDITCFNCTNVNNNDDGEGSPEWIFITFSFTAPESGKSIDTTPTLIGVAGAGNSIILRGTVNGSVVDIATTTADSAGNWRVEVAEDSPGCTVTCTELDLGANTIVAYIGGAFAGSVNVTVDSATPAASLVPRIGSHSDGDRIDGSTPTFTGTGLAGATPVTIYANDANGNLLLSDVSPSTAASVDGSGNYSVTVNSSTPLPKGTNYISIVVDGVSSDILEVELTDPFGVVFDSVTNVAIEGAVVSLYRASDDTLAVPGTDIDAGDSNPQTTAANGFYSFLTANNTYYMTVVHSSYGYPSVQTTFPAGRTIVTGSKGENFTVSGVVIEMDHPMDSAANLIRIEKDANKAEALIGDVVTYTITIENLSADPVPNVFLQDMIPAGFKYLGGRAILDDVGLEPSGSRPIVFSIGTLATGQTKTLKYQLVIGSGVTQGKYDNAAEAQSVSSVRISNVATETVEVIFDPLFDLGMVIGKVFFDTNENGIQDAPEYDPMEMATVIEKPIPNVRLVMEDGTVVVSDEHGRFTLPALNPGRHLVRLDERSLPEGSYLTTDKVVVVDVRPGLTSKVNFGVHIDTTRPLSKDHEFFASQVNVVQDKNKVVPRLNVDLFEDQIAVFDNTFVEKAEFRIFTNYSPFIELWKLDIIDADTRKFVRRFEGDRFNIHDPIFWDGRDERGDAVRNDRRYEYVVYVEDKKGQYDETKAKPIRFKQLPTEESLSVYREDTENRLKAYRNRILTERTVNNLLVQTILVDGETIKVSQIKSKLRSVRIRKDGQLYDEIPIIERRGLTARELLEGDAGKVDLQLPEMEIILPDGEYEIIVQQAQEEDIAYPPDVFEVDREEAGLPTRSYAKDVKIGDNYLFFVAMGDAEVGYTFTRGNVEPAQPDDKFRQGFYSEGKAAYYLEGKILGKYLIKSSFDSDRDKKELFRNIDPDKYYPVYGDASKVDYEATDTQGQLFLLVEWDKSSAIWGNYSIGFDDTEFGQYTRTLYGGKVDFESVGTTEYGDPRTKIVVFRARAQQKSAHNEFLATGGSLYILRHKDIIEGSDKVKIEVRDKITGLKISERKMVEGADYEIDYQDGRIVFWRPVPSIVESYSIVSDSLLDGNLVYVIADYEYDVKDKFDEATKGFRAQQAITDEVIVGTTLVEEAQEEKDYTLRAADVTLRMGRDTTVVAEYAETESEAQNVFVSTDGGLSFTETPTPDGSRGRAYGIRGDTRLFNRLGASSYYKWIDNNFSTSETADQQGKELYGIKLAMDISNDTRVLAQYDLQKLIDDGNLQAQLQLGANKTETTLIQMVHKIRKLTLTAEYRKRVVEERISDFETQISDEEDIIAVQAEYELSDKLELLLAQQVSLGKAGTDQTTIGVKIKPTEEIEVSVKESFSEDGLGTKIDVVADMTEKLALTGGYAIAPTSEGIMKTTSSVGAKAKVDDATDVATALGFTKDEYGGEATSLTFTGTTQKDETTTMETQVSVADTSADGKVTQYTFGTKKKISDELELVSSRTFESAKDLQSTGTSYGLARVKDGKKLQGSLTRRYSENAEEVSRSNIFGLSGDVDDRWALAGTYERAAVRNLDGTQTDRDAIALGIGYVDKDKETGRSLESSTKLELRLDEGVEDKRQILALSNIEGKISEELTLFGKVEVSETRNLTTDAVDEEHREIVLGGAYRPIFNDRLNVLARYTYLENQSPPGQEDTADIEEEAAHVFAAEVIYDLTERWQIAEKFAYRLAEEKVTGFDFVETNTWLMIHRLNYRIDQDWTIGGEFRTLAVREAEDIKRGLLIEGSRRVGEFARIGIGFNFTDFSDDLTALDYTSYGPFIRLTGKFYDRTPEEIERARIRRLEEKIDVWAWQLVMDELARDNSPIIYELNEYYKMALAAEQRGDYVLAQKLFKDIIIAGEMMYLEASEYIRGRIEQEEDWKDMYALGEKYMANGQYEKAKKIFEKILEETNNGMLK